MFKSLITESVNISQVKVKRIEKETFEKDKKNLVDNVII